MTTINIYKTVCAVAADLAIDKAGTVCAFGFDEKNAGRMRSIGITEGTVIRCMYKRKGIAAYLVRGALVGIRDEDARKIFISPKEEDTRE